MASGTIHKQIFSASDTKTSDVNGFVFPIAPATVKIIGYQPNTASQLLILFQANNYWYFKALNYNMGTLANTSVSYTYYYLNE